MPDVNAPAVHDGVVEECRESDHNRNKTSANDTKTIADVVLDAFYKDSSDRARRARTVIMSGVAESAEDDDSGYIRHLLQTEFEYEPASLMCLRLGNNSTGQPRPILVTLPVAEEASWLVANCRRLRKSRDSWVKNNIYINKNLSRIERREAYEGRCRRRAAAGKVANQPIRVVINSHLRSDFNHGVNYRDDNGLHVNLNNLSEFPELNCADSSMIASDAARKPRCTFSRSPELSDSANVLRDQSAAFSSVLTVAARPFAVSTSQAADSASEDMRRSNVPGPSMATVTTVSTVTRSDPSDQSCSVSGETGLDISAPGFSQLMPSPGALSVPSSISIPVAGTTTA